MKKLSIGEWVAVAIALIGGAIIFTIGGATQNFDDLNVADDVVSEVPVPGSDVDEMIVNEDGTEVLGDSVETEGSGSAAGGTFPEGEVPEDVPEEELPVS